MDADVDTATVLGKTVTILRAFTVEDHVVPLAELARRTGIHKATVYRLCGEMVSLRLLDKTSAGYRLSGGLFELGMRAAIERSLLELAMPFIQDLAERTHETVHLGVPEGHDVVYVAKVGGHRQARSPSRVGGRMPMHCTAIGKALLAFGDHELKRAVLTGPLIRRTPHTVVAPGLLRRQLDTIRRAGVAFEVEESTIGLTCIAAPVLDPGDRPLAAISVAGPTSRLRPDQHVNAIRTAAMSLGATLARRFEMT